VIGFDLAPTRQRSVLAHELGHAYYDHRCHDDLRCERQADAYAAALLIDPGEYAQAEALSQDPEFIADELGVPVKLVHAYQGACLKRIGASVYEKRPNSREVRVA
jgi:Zn-dependent peptidase ImmA (M78 family)